MQSDALAAVGMWLSDQGDTSIISIGKMPLAPSSAPPAPQESLFVGGLVGLRALEVHLVDMSCSSSAGSMWLIRSSNGCFQAEHGIQAGNIRHLMRFGDTKVRSRGKGWVRGESACGA